jgi:hypothetical protein
MAKYSDYITKIFAEFEKTQQHFLAHYKINDYEKWFYNHETGLLTLSKGNEAINFKYIVIGTYSLNTKTWKWSWDNEKSDEESKSETLKIKEIGIKENFKKLKNGHFDSDEYDGWEFVAIAHQSVKSIGGYRVQSDHLYIYFLIQELVNNDTAYKFKKNTVTCDKHSTSRAAFICQHLNTKTKTGFEEAFSSYKGMELEEDDDFQAWCSECEKVRQNTKGWTEASMEFANIKLVCEGCYFEIKEFNLGK